VLRITIVSNPIHLEAARRLHLLEAGPRADGPAWGELLVHEPRRIQLTPADRRLWPLRLAVHPLVMAALVVPALLGWVEELRLPHLRRVGRALRLLARRAGRCTLIDDGLDQYRQSPRAVDPLAFPAGTPYWLFSDAADFRAPWCGRFRVGDLGPLYDGQAAAGAEPWPVPGAGGPWRTLIVDAPGLERLGEGLAAGEVAPLRGPCLVVPHPVAAKRSWQVPLGPLDRHWTGPPEQLITASEGLVVVGESMTLLAALSLRPLGARLLVVLPRNADANLRRLVAARAAEDPSVEVLP
jgi:hypothetical protein